MRGSAPLLTLVLLLGCSPGDDAPNAPGAEITDAGDPVEESGGEPADEPAEEGQAVAVELPGLPIGGAEVPFAEPSTQCASVNVSGDPLPSGVQVVVTSFAVPEQLTTSGEPCGDLPPCLGGHRLTADSGGCNVAVTWGGEPLPDGNVAALWVDSATLSCDDESRCVQAVASFQTAGMQTIDLVLPFPGDPTGDPTDDPTG